MWAIAVRRDTLVKTGRFANMLNVFRKKVVSDGNMYFCAPKSVVDGVLQSEARRRCKIAAEGQAVTWRDCLPEYQKGHLETYSEKHLAMILNGSLTEADAWICDLAHNPFQVERSNSMLATLTQSGVRWSFQHERPLLGLEKLAAMGIVIPDFHMEQNDVLSLMAQYSGHMRRLSDSECNRFSGNGMAVCCAGAVIIWTLSHIVPRHGDRGPQSFPVVGFEDGDGDDQAT